MNSNTLTLDGISFEKIEPTAAEKPVYSPSKGKMMTQAQVDREGREAVTRDDFIKNVVISIDTETQFQPLSMECISSGIVPLCDFFTSEPTPVAGQMFAEADGGLHFFDGENWAKHALEVSNMISKKSFIDALLGKHSLEELMRGQNDPNIMTGIKELDDLNNGFRRGQVTIIGSQVGAGATRLLKTIGKGFASQRKTFIISSIEQRPDVVAADIKKGSEALPQFGEFAVVDHGMDVKSMLERVRESIDLAPEDIPEVDAILIDNLGFYMDAGADFLMNELNAIARQYDLAVIGTTALSRNTHYSGDPMWMSNQSPLIQKANAAYTLTRDIGPDETCLKVAKSREYMNQGAFTHFYPRTFSFTKSAV